MIALIVGLAALIAVGSAIAYFTSLNTSEPRALALRTAQTAPLLIGQLGEPVTAGWFTTGKVSMTDESGNAELTIPVSGPKGKGQLHATAARAAAEWKLTSLSFRAEGESARLDLLPANR